MPNALCQAAPLTRQVRPSRRTQRRPHLWGLDDLALLVMPSQTCDSTPAGHEAAVAASQRQPSSPPAMPTLGFNRPHRARRSDSGQSPAPATRRSPAMPNPRHPRDRTGYGETGRVAVPHRRRSLPL